MKSLLQTFARLTLVFLIAVSVSCIGKRITKANVDQVTEGMSKKQVESILGQPTASKMEDPTIMKQTTYVYRQGKDSVTIVFKDDKVQSKDSTISDGFARYSRHSQGFANRETDYRFRAKRDLPRVIALG